MSTQAHKRNAGSFRYAIAGLIVLLVACGGENQAPTIDGIELVAADPPVIRVISNNPCQQPVYFRIFDSTTQETVWPPGPFYAVVFPEYPEAFQLVVNEHDFYCWGGFYEDHVLGVGIEGTGACDDCCAIAGHTLFISAGCDN